MKYWTEWKEEDRKGGSEDRIKERGRRKCLNTTGGSEEKRENWLKRTACIRHDR